MKCFSTRIRTLDLLIYRKRLRHGAGKSGHFRKASPAEKNAKLGSIKFGASCWWWKSSETKRIFECTSWMAINSPAPLRHRNDDPRKSPFRREIFPIFRLIEYRHGTTFLEPRFSPIFSPPPLRRRWVAVINIAEAMKNPLFVFIFIATLSVLCVD